MYYLLTPERPSKKGPETPPIPMRRKPVVSEGSKIKFGGDWRFASLKDIENALKHFPVESEQSKTPRKTKKS